MEYKQGQINEIIGTALHLAGKVAGKIAAGAIKGGKKGKASFKNQTQKARNFDANQAIVNSSDRAERKIGRKGKPMSASNKASNKVTSKLEDIKNTRNAANQVSKSEGKSAKVKAENKAKKVKIKTLRKGAKDAYKLGKATSIAKDADANLKARVDEATFGVTFISEGHKKTKRQYKKAHKDKDMGRMVKLAKRHKKQKDKSLDRKALRDVMKHSEGDVNEGSSGLQRLARKASSEKHSKENMGRNMDNTMRKLGKKIESSRKRDSDRHSTKDGEEYKKKPMSNKRKRDNQAALSKKTQRDFEKRLSFKHKGLWNKNNSSEKRNRPTG